MLQLEDSNFAQSVDLLFKELAPSLPARTLSSSDIYFDARLDDIIGNNKYADHQILQFVIKLGRHAEESNAKFLARMKSAGDYCLVNYGETGVSRLSERFSALYLDSTAYLFYFSEAIHSLLDNHDLEVMKLLEGRPIQNVTISGPMGEGKSFFLQYFVRRLRQLKNLYRVLLIPNPQLLFFREMKDLYCLVVLEIVFAFAGDLEIESFASSAPLSSETPEEGSMKYFCREISRSFQYFRSQGATLNGSKEHLENLLSSAKTFCERTLKSKFILALDQENSLLSPGETNEPTEIKSMLYGVLSKQANNCHHLVTTTSMTSDGLDKKSRRKYMQLIQEASDEEVEKLVKMAYNIHPIPIDAKHVSLTARFIINHVGRWFREIFKIITSHIRLSEQWPLPVHCNFYWLNEDPEVEIWTDAHTKWFESLNKNGNRKAQKMFLALLKIANRGPNSYSSGYRVVCDSDSPFSVPGIPKPTASSILERYKLHPNLYAELSKLDPLDQEGFSSVFTRYPVIPVETTNQTPACPSKPAPENTSLISQTPPVPSEPVSGNPPFISLNVFKNDQYYGDLAVPEKAMKFLDPRFFFIDKDLGVRAIFPKVLQEIEKVHASDDLFQQSYEEIFVSLISQDRTIQAIMFEHSLVARLQAIKTPFNIVINASTRNRQIGFPVVFPVAVRKQVKSSSVITEIHASVEGFATHRDDGILFVPDVSNFPDIDLFIITKAKEISSGAPDFVPLLLKDSHYWDTYLSLASTQNARVTCDLVLVQITCDVPGHDKADGKLVDKFPLLFKCVQPAKKPKKIAKNVADLAESEDKAIDSNV